MKKRNWTALYVMLSLAALIIFVLGQWGAALTVVCLSILINRAVYLSEMAFRMVINQQEMLSVLKDLSVSPAPIRSAQPTPPAVSTAPPETRRRASIPQEA